MAVVSQSQAPLGREGGSDAAASARYQSLNSWAWKALGVVELVSYVAC